MPDSSQTQPAAFNCEGGLVLNRSSFLMKPGEALVLENFEPDVEGGYRRMNGYRKYFNHIVPQTASSSERIIGFTWDVCVPLKGLPIRKIGPNL